MSTLAEMSPATRRPSSIPRSPLRALRSPALWLASLHLALDVPVAGVVGAGLLVLLALSAVGTVLALLGVPCWLVTVWLLGRVSTLERARYRRTLGVRIDSPRLPVRDRGWLRWASALAASRTVWRQVGYFVALAPLSLVNACGLMLAWFLPPTLVLLPMYAPQFSTQHTYIGPYSIGQDASGWVVSAIAMLFLLLVSPRVIRGLARTDVAFARAMLGPSATGRLTERVGELETSRRRALDAADDERGRIERDLHDGAQQRLVSLAMALGRVRRRLPDAVEPATRELIDEAHHQAMQAITELRDLTRGLHPPVLTDRGLDAALSAVAARAPVPVRVDVAVEPRPPATVEAVAYFVVTEALTNVAKHAQATRASVVIRREHGVLRVTVGDDGVGGAAADRGSGLRGLADRLAGVDGRLSVVSPPGGPTVLTVEVPCAS